MIIRGTTALVAHIGFPTDGFVSPLIYNPFFDQRNLDAAVVPMGCRAEDYPTFLKALFTVTNVRGALITMPHKVTTAALVDQASEAVRLAGSCNAVRRLPDGRLQGDLFDGTGFVRALGANGCAVEGMRALVIGAGGVGAAIAASLASSGVGSLALLDARAAAAQAVADRLAQHFGGLEVRSGDGDPAGRDLVVNATPLGTRHEDPLPFDVSRLAPDTFVADVVMTATTTRLVTAARERGCRVQTGTDMLFEQIPLYLEFFGFPTTTPAELRRLARLATPPTTLAEPRP
jgi:shikimate dehydrogenase